MEKRYVQYINYWYKWFTKYLDTTSNNIANANSYGFKKSRAEFADLYTNSVFTSSKTATGMGTNTTTVAQQFTYKVHYQVILVITLIWQLAVMVSLC